ncbi:MAG: TonB-dependent receptor [Deltaproteobacteria bacterium]|nr:TonB-dependent receptor [Deltaproteobacteria bacterium]
MSQDDQQDDDVIKLGQVTVTGKIVDEATANIPAVVESITAEGVERINAVETSDVFKYMPGSYLRKLYPGGTNSPLVIRGNNSTLTGRTLVLMDGIRISDFTAAGNSNAPKWFTVAPQEIEKVDVIYGPFSAALSGNSMSGTAMITTHMPERLEVQADGKYFYQNFHEYRTDDDMEGYTAFASAGNKTGNLSYNFWFNRLETEIQSTSYVAKTASDGGATVGNPVSGWVADKDPIGNDRYILGSGGVKDVVNNTFKVKLGYDLTPESQLRFTSVLWDFEQDGDSPQSYIRDAAGNPVYAGTVDIDGVSFNLSNSTFTYSKSERQDLLNALTYSMDSPGGLNVTAAVSAYNTLNNVTQTSSTAAPDSKSGGAGKVSDGEEGWYTADLKAAGDFEWRGFHTVTAGYHVDQYFTDNETWNASDWLRDTRTTLNQGAEGKTRTQACFVEDTWHIEDHWSVYLGGRYEWWRGFDGSKSIDTPSGRVTTELEERKEADFSPKLSTTFSPNDAWRLRFSLAMATRYPTVGELYYGGINASGIIPNANPDLEPERSVAKDFTITRFVGSDGEARLTFFEDDVEDAIYSQTNSYTLVKNFQNVDEVRTRGVEFAFNMRRFFIDGLGLFTNVAWTDSKILRNDSVPESVGKDFPRVPEWRAKCVLDYSPTDKWAFTLAGHYSGEQYGNLDNSDTEGGYGGIDDFLVFDAKFSYRFSSSWLAAVGVDNITDELYHVSHPYPMRTFFAELKYTF